ncbi:MAG: transglutaminase-like domain-containing protein, partial [Phycisphaerales bacterium]|nr:transglutaminase-like domain-containing protein [Phycisphaerales bacterium]
GDWAVTGPNARGTGAVDSEYFLESDLASIYDVLTDAYGEPLVAKDLFRSISISPDQMLDPEGGKAPDFGEAGRQFSLYRQTRKQRDRSKSVDASALLFVEGDTPLHLAMTVYDEFDGVRWHEPEESTEICRFEAREPDASWLWLPRERGHAFLGGSRLHTLRFGRLSSERIPLPNHIERLRLGRAGGANARQWAMETFAWVYEGILRARHCLPSGTYLEVGSHPVDPSNLDECLFCPASIDDPHLDIPEHLHGSATALASQFTHLPRGWDQIEGLIEHLRLHYAHDRDAVLPPTCDDPIHHLLHESRDGPAYQFATTATLALRSLGYRTRVVSGFYVNPRNYVAAAGYTTVKTDDAHFWIEIQTTPGVWISLDPTPGYEVRWHRPSMLSRISNAVVDVRDWIVAHPGTSAAILLASILLWWRRWSICERLMTLWCVYWPFRNDDDRLVHTLRLLDLRSRLSGQRRPLSVTPKAWYGRIAEPACQSFIARLYESLYANTRRAGANGDTTVQALCHAAICSVSLRRLRMRPLASR